VYSLNLINVSQCGCDCAISIGARNSAAFSGAGRDGGIAQSAEGWPRARVRDYYIPAEEVRGEGPRCTRIEISISARAADRADAELRVA